jgi:hypothetical protein
MTLRTEIGVLQESIKKCMQEILVYSKAMREIILLKLELYIFHQDSVASIYIKQQEDSLLHKLTVFR